MAVPRCAIDVGFTVDVVDDVVTAAPVLVVVRIWLLLTDITRATTLFLSKLLFLPFKCAMARRGMLSDVDDAPAEDGDDDVGGDVVLVDCE